MTKISAALLGIEHPHSLAHLRTLQELPEVEHIYLWDENQAALEAAKQAQGNKIAGIYTNLNELLNHDEIFFVITALRNDLSPAVCLQALAAGKHIMAEKPIGRTAADVAQVIAAAEANGRQLSVCYQNRRNPLIRQMRSPSHRLLHPSFNLIHDSQRMLANGGVPAHGLFGGHRLYTWEEALGFPDALVIAGHEDHGHTIDASRRRVDSHLAHFLAKVFLWSKKCRRSSQVTH